MSLPAQLQAFSLYGAGATLGDQDITLTTFTGIDGEAMNMSFFGSKGYGTLEPGSGTQEEQISFTGITNNANGTTTLNGVKTVLFLSPFTETAGLAKSHAGGVRFVISNTAGFEAQYATLNDVSTFTVSPIVPTPTTNFQAANKVYADSIALAGAPDASTSTKGVTKLTTAPTSPTDPIAIGATDASTTPTANLIPRSNSSNKIAQGWLDLAATWVFTGITDTTAALWKLGGVAFTGTMALLNEAATFFNATNITGAEAETLSDGSDANTLHVHPIYSQVTSDLTASQRTFLGNVNDGMTAVVATGTLSRAQTSTLFSASATGGSAVLQGQEIRYSPSTGVGLDWNDNPNLKLVFRGTFSSAVTQDWFAGFVATNLTAAFVDATTVVRHIGWMVQDGTLYASCADGSNQNRSSAITATLTNANVYEIIWTGGTNIVFKLNGTTVATLTTNMPTGTSGSVTLNFAYTDQASSFRSFAVSHPFALTLTNL